MNDPQPTLDQPASEMPTRRSNWKLTLSCWLVYLLVRALAATYRVRVFGSEHREKAARHHAHGSFCLALWHEHLFAGIVAHAGQSFAPLASLSSDGEIVTFVMDRLGFKTVRGSSSRRGEEARDELVEITERGWFTAITVDGPKGPRHRVKGGIIDVARRTGVAALPMVALADRAWVLSRSWDQFKIPKPFARIAVHYGAPVFVPAETQGLAFGEAKAAVRRGLDDVQRAAAQDLAAWR